MSKKTVSLEDHERVKQILHEQILKKDAEIIKLKEENKILIKTSLKRSEELQELKEQLDNFKK